jgi:hypothetical protein
VPHTSGQGVKSVETTTSLEFIVFFQYFLYFGLYCNIY